MKKWLALGLTIISLSMSSLSFASVDSSNPYTLINSVAENAFSRLKEDKESYQANPERLRLVVEEELMPYINVRYAAMKVLGSQARKATKEERDLFTESFYDYLVASYAQILTEYTDQAVNVEQIKAIDPKRKVVSVRVDIWDSTRPPIRLDFILRKNGKTQEWQGFDVHVEGVSLLDTKASEWRGQLRKNGIAAVAEDMEIRAKSPISKSTEAS